EWPIPTNITEIRSFLGLASYYRRFVNNFSMIAAPLTNLLHKDRPYQWNNETQDAFDQLKKSLTSAPVLIIPNPELPFTITADTSDLTIDVVLSQQPGKFEQPVA